MTLAVSLWLAHCATAEREDSASNPEPPPTTGGAQPAGGAGPTGGAKSTGGVFTAMTGGSSGVTGGAAPTGGASGMPNSGSGGRTPSASGGRSGQGGSGIFGGGTELGGETGDGGEDPMPSTGGTSTGTGGGAPRDPCSDGKRNGSETDVDCGGSCALCALGMSCDSGTDCEGGNCEGGNCAVPGHCAHGWRDDPCGESCLERTQSDQRACELVLDCFVENDCGPATCTGVTQVCGNNALQQGSAPYPYAAAVYDCLCN